MRAKSQGAKANAAGERAIKLIRQRLLTGGYQFEDCTTLEALCERGQGLYAETGRFAEEVTAPLAAAWHVGRKFRALARFAVLTHRGEGVLIGLKFQDKDGSAEARVEFHAQQLISAIRPGVGAALLVMGPLKGRDEEEGFSPWVLGPIWDRARHFSGDKLLLFRSYDKLCVWVSDGMPVAGPRVNAQALFNQYCDREP